MPSLHAHPEWQLTLPEGESGCQTIRLRVTAAGSAYADSDEYVLQIANDPAACGRRRAAATPTATARSTSPTASRAPHRGRARSPCADPAPCDVDGNGAVSVTDGVNVLREAAGLDANLTCPDL